MAAWSRSRRVKSCSVPQPEPVGGPYDIVALVSNDLVTDQRMQKSLSSLTAAGYRCLLLGREKAASRELDPSWPFAQERHRLRAYAGKRFYWQLNRAHFRRLLELRPGAVLAVDLDTIWAGHRASRALGVPFVFDAHELFEEQPEVARRWWIKAVWYLVGKRFVPAAAACYTVGGGVAEVLRKRYRRPFAVVRNFPVAGDARPVARVLPKGDQPFVILYQGALNEGRGLEELLEAAQQLTGVEVWIAGDGPEAGRLRAFAKTFPSAGVTFFGEVEPKALAGLTGRAHLGYALMRNVSRNYYLSLSNKSVDYLRAGLPSLQMAWPEYEAIHREYGCYHLVEGLSVAAVVSAVRACRDLEYYNALASASARAGAELTWEREAEVLADIVRSVLPST